MLAIGAVALALTLSGCSNESTTDVMPSTTDVPETPSVTDEKETIFGTSIERVSKEQVISNNNRLEAYGLEMTINATYVYQTLIDEGWTHNAICAIIGNMQHESYLNPGKSEDGNSKSGYGLVQWTPYQGIDYY